MTDTLQIIMSVVGVGVTVMLALVAGVWHLRGRLDQMETRLQGIENQMEARFERVESQIEARFERAESQMEARFERAESQIEVRFERAESQMEVRFERTESQMEARFERAETQMEARFERAETQMEARFERVESQMEARFERAETQMEARFERVENRMENFGVGIRSLNQQLASVVGILPSAFAFLHRSKVITDEEYRESVGQFTNRVAQGAESLVDHLTRSMNPLTPDEGQRFKALINKARLGEFFSYEEVVEYNKLISKVQTEHPDDPRIWPLVALGVFLSGLYVGKRQDDMPQTGQH